MNKIRYHTMALRSLGIVILIWIAGFASSCGPTPQSSSAYTTYNPPAWAPASDQAASVPYYYFPDYGMYYDASAQQYYYQNNGSWIASQNVPYGNVDLNNSYVVLLDRNASIPWQNHDYYQRNYPPHAHDQYQQIVTNNRVIPNMAPQHVIVPRAYNENTDRVTFEERAQQTPVRPGARPTQTRVATHEVPMGTIAPKMPPEARQYKYGGAQKGR